MSKKREKIKQKRRLFTEVPKSNHKIVPKRKPEAVMTHKYSSGSEEKPSINNVLPGRKYKVITKPERWGGNHCRFVDQIGTCLGTDRVHGAKLKFISGEICSIPFENIELHEAFRYKTPANTLPVVAIEPEKRKYYKVIKKPAVWKTQCKYVGQIGLCIKIDERGARLSFIDGNDLSFLPDCIVEAEAIDLNKPVSEITEDTVQIGNIYRVIKNVNKFGVDAEQLIGKVGKSLWANYRGVCMKFADKSGYVIPFDCLEKVFPQQPPNPVSVPKALNANNMVIHRKYKVATLPQDFNGDMKILGQLGKVMWCSDVSRVAMLHFDDGYEVRVPFTCIEELPRPSEEELVALIKQHPERVLRIIKGLSKITKLKPVIDFVQGGQLPEVVAEITPQVYGPPSPDRAPECMMSETTPSPIAGTIGEVCDGMMDHVLAMIDRADGPKPNTEKDSPTEYAAED